MCDERSETGFNHKGHLWSLYATPNSMFSSVFLVLHGPFEGQPERL